MPRSALVGQKVTRSGTMELGSVSRWWKVRAHSSRLDRVWTVSSARSQAGLVMIERSEDAAGATGGTPRGPNFTSYDRRLPARASGVRKGGGGAEMREGSCWEHEGGRLHRSWYIRAGDIPNVGRLGGTLGRQRTCDGDVGSRRRRG